MDTDFSNKHILIVEAFKVSRDIIKQAALSLGPLSVDVCTNSKSALAKCKSTQYDIIFMGYDLGEGRKNGQQVLEECRVNKFLKRTTVCIMITAESSQEMVLSALEHKPDDYLTKPFTTKELLKRLFIGMHKKHTLREVYDALDKGDRELAIKLCDQHIDDNVKYSDDCLAIKSRQLFELGRREQAKDIYYAKKDDPNCKWATIGLGKVYLLDKDYENAAKVLKHILDDNPKYMPAYQWLAKSYESLGEYSLAENILERAIEISPRSVKLTQLYASICELNGKYEEAAITQNKVIELSKNSVHYSADNAINFARCISEHTRDIAPSVIKELYQKALKELSEASKEFGRKDIKVKTNLASACLFYAKNDKLSASNALTEAEKQIEKYGTQLPPSVHLELAKSYSYMEKEDKAQEIFDQLVKEHGRDEKLMASVDKTVDDPLSEFGKKRTQEIIKTGIEHYNAENYTAAIIEFTTALNQYPKHVGILLNLAQALLMSYTSNVIKISHLVRAKQIIESLAELPRSHQHFSRLVGLRDKLREAEAGDKK